MNRRPHVTLKYAQSFDGRIATRNGHNELISGPETLQLCHQIRAASDAILVGVGTVIADDPSLTTRLVEGPSPHRFVLDSRLRTPLSARLVETARAVPTSIVYLEDTIRNTVEDPRTSLHAKGVSTLAVAADPKGYCDLHELLESMWDLGIRTLMVEGGAGVITSMLRESLVDKLVLVQAPLAIGSGREAVGDLGVRSINMARRATTVSVAQAGNDIVWEMHFPQGDATAT